MCSRWDGLALPGSCPSREGPLVQDAGALGPTLFARDPPASEAREATRLFITPFASQPGAGMRRFLSLSTLDSVCSRGTNWLQRAEILKSPGGPEPGPLGAVPYQRLGTPGFSSADFWQHTDPSPAAPEPGPSVGRAAGTSMPGFGGACSSVLGLWGEGARGSPSQLWPRPQPCTKSMTPSSSWKCPQAALDVKMCLPLGHRLKSPGHLELTPPASLVLEHPALLPRPCPAVGWAA